MGLTQYQFGVDNVKMLVNLALARGMVGRPNTGIMPIRGHSECRVRRSAAPIPTSSREVARSPSTQRASRRRGSTPSLESLGSRPRTCSIAPDEGLDLLYLVGGNHLETMPDREHARRSLERVKLRVHQDIVLNTSTLLDAEEAVVVLPAQTRYEQRSGGTSTSTERRIRFTPEIPGPASRRRDPSGRSPASSDKSSSPRAPISSTTRPTHEIQGRNGRAHAPLRRHREAREEGDSLQWGGPQLGGDRFGTPDGKAHFSVVRIPRVDVPLGQFLLAMRRGKQFNSMTYGNRDPLVAGARRDAVLLAERDLAELGLRTATA